VVECGAVRAKLREAELRQNPIDKTCKRCYGTGCKDAKLEQKNQKCSCKMWHTYCDCSRGITFRTENTKKSPKKARKKRGQLQQEESNGTNNGATIVVDRRRLAELVIAPCRTFSIFCFKLLADLILLAIALFCSTMIIRRYFPDAGKKDEPLLPHYI